MCAVTTVTSSGTISITLSVVTKVRSCPLSSLYFGTACRAYRKPDVSRNRLPLSHNLSGITSPNGKRGMQGMHTVGYDDGSSTGLQGVTML